MPEVDTLIDATAARSLQEAAIADGELVFWVVYDHPLDFPHVWVARPFHTRPAVSPIMWCHLEGAHLIDLYRQLPRDLMRVQRFDGDDAKIFETWI